MHRHARLPVTLLLTALLPIAAAPAADASPAAPGGPQEARVRLTGDLLLTAAEPGQPQQAAVSRDGRLVPVDLDPADLDGLTSGREVTLDVTVPDEVEQAAEEGDTLALRDGSGTPTQHRLDDTDLAEARAATPADDGSAIGRATLASTRTPGAAALAVDDVVASAPAASTLQRSAAATRTRDVTVVRVIPKGASGSGMPSESAVRQQVSGADRFWRASSEGAVGTRLASLRPTYRARYSCDDFWQLWDDTAQHIGWRERPSTTLALVVPEGAGCSHGLGSIGESTSSAGYLYTSGAGSDVLAHEIGHNMSLQHADSLVCATQSDAAYLSNRFWRSGCRQYDYGDGQDIMGIDDLDTPSGPLSTPQALRLGFMPSWAVRSVGDATTTVTLRPLAQHTGQRAARVVNRATGVTYVVEYRPLAGADRYNAWGQRGGVRVLRVNPTTGETVLLDPSPTGAGGRGDADATLAAGRTFRSHDGGLTITTVSTSSASAVVRVDATAPRPSFVRTREPAVTGTRGVGRTLGVDRGGWSPAPTGYSYQWKRNGIAISGATGSTYRATTADAGRYLSVTVTVRRSGYRDASRTTPRVGVPMHATTAPSIAGSPRVGTRLTARVGAWTPQATGYGYQWYRDGSAIPGATAYGYTLTSADAGRRMRLKVTARRSGYSSGQAWSPTTGTVAR